MSEGSAFVRHATGFSIGSFAEDVHAIYSEAYKFKEPLEQLKEDLQKNNYNAVRKDLDNLENLLKGINSSAPIITQFVDDIKTAVNETFNNYDVWIAGQKLGGNAPLDQGLGLSFTWWFPLFGNPSIYQDMLPKNVKDWISDHIFDHGPISYTDPHTGITYTITQTKNGTIIHEQGTVADFEKAGFPASFGEKPGTTGLYPLEQLLDKFAF